MHSVWNERRGQRFSATHLNFYEFPSDDPALLEAWCYTDAISYAPGDVISFHTSTTALMHSIEVVRDGAAPATVYQVNELPGQRYETPADCYARGCGWPVAHRWTVPADLPSGGYLVLTRATDAQGDSVEHQHFFVVRAPREQRRADLLLVCATNTWVAYNGWGGASHYEGNVHGPDENCMSPRLHLHRPWARGQVWLPEGAPRIPVEAAPAIGAVPRYASLEYAFANGFSKYYAAAGWASYERHFVVWAENNGYRLDFATQHDLHLRPDVVADYPCVVIVGHDEYWSAAMRDTVDAYVDGGGRVARFGANFLWQVRLEDEGQVQVCYKYPAPYHPGVNDPLEESAPRLLTGIWENAKVGRPGALTFGLSGAYGVYARLGGANPRNSGAFTVFQPRHWAFAGTDLYYGDNFGGAAGIFGYETDAVPYTFGNGLPVPIADPGVPASLQILAMGFATTFEEDHGNKGTRLYAGDADRTLMALSLYGDTSAESIARCQYGAGMVGHFTRGRGEVFNGGSCEWVNGLRLCEPVTERITRNVLDRFVATPSEDN